MTKASCLIEDSLLGEIYLEAETSYRHLLCLLEGARLSRLRLLEDLALVRWEITNEALQITCTVDDLRLRLQQPLEAGKKIFL